MPPCTACFSGCPLRRRPSRPSSPTRSRQPPQQPGSPESVHLADYPVYDARYSDEELEWKMAVVRRAVSMGRALALPAQPQDPPAPGRRPPGHPGRRANGPCSLRWRRSLRDELNVKEVIFRDDEEELVEYQAKANFRVLGKELGKDMKEGGGTNREADRAADREPAGRSRPGDRGRRPLRGAHQGQARYPRGSRRPASRS